MSHEDDEADNEEEPFLTTLNGHKITYAAIRAANGSKPYEADLVGLSNMFIKAAVNQGIDAHLEACYCPDRGDRYEWSDNGRLICRISAESLPVLLRRLYEMDTSGDDDSVDDTPYLLADDILRTLGFNEGGEQVGRTALGLD